MKQHISQKGFTLIELMIAFSIFVILIAVVTGIFIRSIRTQRHIIQFSEAIDNATQVLEQMTREMRTGKNFKISDDKKAIFFTNANGADVGYRLVSEQIGKCSPENKGCADGNGFDENFSPLTGEGVRVARLQFFGADSIPPIITIAVGVQSAFCKGDDIEINSCEMVNMQTSVSTRALSAE